jgi:hypothetical protein
MTETTSGGGTTGRAGTAAPASAAEAMPQVGTPQVGTPQVGTPQVSMPRTLSIHLPLVTVTFGPQPVAPVPAQPAAPVPAQPPAPSAGNGATLERLAFYGGVAAAGALGALEWPVAIAVATGTWVAQHTLPAPRRPADSAPPESTAVAAASPATVGPPGTPAPVAAGTTGRG